MGYFEECELETTWYIPVYKAVWSDGVADATWYSASLDDTIHVKTEAEAEAMLGRFKNWWDSQDRGSRTIIVTAVVREVRTTVRTVLK